MTPSRQDSQSLLEEYIENPNLRKHCEMVAVAMEAYAQHLGKSDEVVEMWWTAGLLHDIDWEKFPEEHPNKAINEILPEKGYDQTILDAIAAHAPDRTGKEASEEIETYLYACDELSGFINAVSLMRPTGLEGMKVKSITKRLKQKNFAAGVNRDDIAQGLELIGVEQSEHIQFMIEAFQEAGY